MCFIIKFLYVFCILTCNINVFGKAPVRGKKLFNSLVLPHAYFEVRLSFDLSDSSDVFFILFFNSWKHYRANTSTWT